jgi:anti-sigma regulatory factor (Ser/Thr protein kinase)
VTAAVRADRFEHEALFYRGDEDFLAGLMPFIRDGLDRDEDVVVAEPLPRLDQLRDALGSDADTVEFLDMAQVGVNPGRIIGIWADRLDGATRAGRRLRGVGEPAYPGRRPAEFVECALHELLLNHAFDEPIWAGRTEAELAECHQHESLLNLAFGAGPGWRLLCPYDRGHLPRAVTQAAQRTHPVIATSDSRSPSSAYVAAGHVAAFAERLREPGDAVLRGQFGGGDVPAIRRTVAQWARSCGLPEDRVRVLELAASELAADSIRRGGTGTLAMWLGDGAALVQFSDAGALGDPLTGRLRPRGDEGGAIHLLNQLCDLVQVRSSDRGTTVRVTTWL